MNKILTENEKIENIAFTEIKNLAPTYARGSFAIQRQTKWLLKYWLEVLEAIEDNTYHTVEH